MTPLENSNINTNTNNKNGFNQINPMFFLNLKCLFIFYIELPRILLSQSHYFKPSLTIFFDPRLYFPLCKTYSHLRMNLGYQCIDEDCKVEANECGDCVDEVESILVAQNWVFDVVCEEKLEPESRQHK